MPEPGCAGAFGSKDMPRRSTIVRCEAASQQNGGRKLDHTDDSNHCR